MGDLEAGEQPEPSHIFSIPCGCGSRHTGEHGAVISSGSNGTGSGTLRCWGNEVLKPKLVIGGTGKAGLHSVTALTWDVT